MTIRFIILLAISSLISTFQKRSIHERWNIELNKYVDQKGRVNYIEWNKNEEGLNAYIIILKKNHPQKFWTKNQIKTYWINAYNALTVKAILNNYPINSIRDIKNVWSDKVINYSFKSYSLDEIEHEILRKMDDPRIHFAINCASISCPKLLNSAYMPNKIEKQLEDSTRLFLLDSTKNIILKKEIKLSKIFLWFKKDFINNEQLMSFIEKYSLIQLDDPKVKYFPYDWNLNVQ